MVTITENYIDTLFTEIAPKVAQLTEWDLGMSDLNVEIRSKEGFFDTYLEQTAQHMGLDLEKERSKYGGVPYKMQKYMMDNQIMGLYDPVTSSIYFVEENCKRVNHDMFATLVGHELVHRGQDAANPDFFEEIYSRVRALNASPSKQEKKKLSQERQALMCLTEGDATNIQERLTEDYPNGKADMSMLVNPSSLLAVTIGLKKTMQYVKGAAILKAEFPEHGRSEINALYQDIDHALDVFSPDSPGLLGKLFG